MKYVLSAVMALFLLFGFLLYKTYSRPTPFKNWFRQSTIVPNHIANENRADSETLTTRTSMFNYSQAEPRMISQVLKAVDINTEELSEQDPATIERLFKESKEIVAKLSICLGTENRCGQTKETAEGYFDPDKTPLHRDLNRVLIVMGEITKMDPSYLHSLDREALLRVTKINNDNAPILALRILIRTKMTEAEVSTVIANTKYLRGQVRSLVLESLAADQLPESPSLRANYVAAIFDSLSNQQDRTTAYEIQKNLSRFRLAKEEFTVAIKKSCFLRKDTMGEDIWPILRKNITLQGEAMGFDINPDEYCKEAH